MNGHTTREKGQELRYLRRLDSRGTRVVRRGLVFLRGAGLVGFHGALLAVAIWTGIRAAERVAGSAEFDVNEIELQGAHRADAVEIRRDLERLRDANLLDVDLESIEERLLSHAWVRHVAVRRVLPDTLLVEIQECAPRAIAAIDGNLHYVDGEGRLVQPLGSARAEDLPVVTGLEGGPEGSGEARLLHAIEILDRLERRVPDLARDVSELDVADERRVAIRTSSAGPLLYLDPARAERNVGEYLELRDGILRRFEEVAYVDLRWEGRISVLPMETNGLEREDG